MSEPTPIDEGMSALVRAAQTGDEAAFERLVRRFHRQIHRWALVRTGDRDDADDVTQEALIRLHRHIGSFDGRSRFTTWLYRVTQTASLDLHRKRVRRERLARKLRREPKIEAQDPQAERLTSDERRVSGLIRTFTAELSDRQREVFDLVDLQGFAAAEVSELLGLEAVTVRSHLFRARKTIRKKILESAPELVEGYGP